MLLFSVETMIEFKKEGDSLFCTPKNDIIASNVPEMRDQLISGLDSQEWEELIFSCHNVKTMDSIGVNLIVGLFKRADAAGKPFKIIECNEPIQKVLELFRLNEKFPVEA